MAGYAWVLKLRPECEEDYKKRHDQAWPEMLEALRVAGISIYSIFRHGLTLFDYFETDDLAAATANLDGSSVAAKWGEWINPLLNPDIDPVKRFSNLLPMQFHME